MPTRVLELLAAAKKFPFGKCGGRADLFNVIEVDLGNFPHDEFVTLAQEFGAPVDRILIQKSASIGYALGASSRFRRFFEIAPETFLCVHAGGFESPITEADLPLVRGELVERRFACARCGKHVTSTKDYLCDEECK